MTAQAVDYYYKGNQNGWSASAPMAVSMDGYYSYAEAKSYADNGNTNNHFKIAKSKDGWDYGNSYLKSGFNNTNITNMGAWDGDGNCCIYHDASYYVLVYHPNTAINNTNNPIICASTTLPYDGDCHLMGIGGDWSTGIKMELNANNKNEFILLDQPINEPFKFKLNNTWTTEVENYTENGVNWVETTPGSGQYNITLPAGNYDFYFKKDIMKVYIARNTVVTTTANPAEGGTLTGAGVYNNNDDVTLTATANTGYNFVNWTKASVEVSTDATYKFKAAGDVEYVANFQLKSYSVTATANPVEGGTVTGSDTYNHGATATLTATPNTGYEFVNWTNAGVEVSTEATYSFTVTENVELVANFKATTITLTTGNNDAVIAANIGNTVDVVIERSFTANDGYYTLCVPFNMPASVIGKAYSLGTITEHVAGKGININLEEVSELSAGMPYLVLPKANMSELIVENVTIAEDDIAGQNITNEELNVQIFFQGYYSAPGLTTNGTTEYYVGNNGYLYNGKVEIRGLSGLFTITDTEGNPAKVRARVVTREDAATGFENITNGENTTIKLIENGQLIIIRNGEKFNAQGQKL